MQRTTSIQTPTCLKRRSRQFLGPTLLLLLSATAQAAPKILDVSILESNYIEITGDNFGSGPRVAIFDDFNDASMIGDREVNLDPLKGAWAEHSGTGYIESKNSTEDNALIVRDTRLGVSSRFVFAEDDNEGVHGKKHFQEIYLSYSEKDFRSFPGRNATENSFSDISSAKPAWLMFGHRGDNTQYALSIGSPAGHDIVVATWSGGGFLTDGNNTRMQPTFWHHELTENWAFQDWNTISFHAKLNPNDPYGKAEGFISFVNRNFALTKKRDGNFMTDQTEEGLPYPYWDRVKFYSWIRTDESDVKRAVDNVYVAVGENANARVVLTDNESLDKSRVLVHALPISWSESSITVRIPHDSRNPKYLHVIDSNETSSSGAFICLECPEPTELKVN